LKIGHKRKIGTPAQGLMDDTSRRNHMLETSGEPLITRERVFAETWLPGDLHYRTGELEAMSAALRPILDGRVPTGLFCWGPSGAGKTTCVTSLLEDLKTEAALTTAEISCWTNRTRHGVLYTLLSELGGASSLHPTASSSTAVLDRLAAELTTPTVFVLDEVDQLEELEVLYDLYHLDSVTAA